MSRAKNWCFTLNNYEANELEALRALTLDQVNYLCWQRERGDQGTPHLQGFIVCKKQLRLSAVKALVGQKAHLEVCKGSPESNRKYCSKEGGEDFTEIGTLPESSQGKRADLDGFKEAVKGGELSIKRIREDYSEIIAKYPRFVREYLDDNTPLPDMEMHELFVWQEDLNKKLIHEADDRQINFIYDPKGNKGKTWFAKYYASLHDNAQILSSGKAADLAYALIPNLRVLFINVTRQQVDYLNYSFLEAVKDGVVQSPKYESRVRYFNKVHVVVLMNQMPDMSKLSEDRYNIIQLD